MSIKFRCRSTDRCVFLRDVEWTKSQAHVYRPHNEPLRLSLKGNSSADDTGTACVQTQVQDKTGKYKIHNTGTDKHAKVLCTESLSLSL